MVKTLEGKSQEKISVNKSGLSDHSMSVNM